MTPAPRTREDEWMGESVGYFLNDAEFSEWVVDVLGYRKMSQLDGESKPCQWCEIAVCHSESVAATLTARINALASVDDPAAFVEVAQGTLVALKLFVPMLRMVGQGISLAQCVTCAEAMCGELAAALKEPTNAD